MNCSGGWQHNVDSDPSNVTFVASFPAFGQQPAVTGLSAAAAQSASTIQGVSQKHFKLYEENKSQNGTGLPFGSS